MIIIRTITLLLFLSIPLSITGAASTPHITEIRSGDSTINVYFESRLTAQQQQKLLIWLDETAKTISTLYGEFPVKQSHVHIYSSFRSGEPVPWGEVWKNDEYRINFHVNPDFSLQDFLDDWTATHEFSHLFHPYPGRGNAWFGEGLASYYQNILKARYGSLTEQEALQKLYNGFRRGENNQAKTGLTLKQASAAMRQNRSYMHVYWGGAAYFLNVDVRLRQSSYAKKSLDTTWLAFKNCCLRVESNWSLPKLISKLDELSNSNIFTTEYQKIINQRTFPGFRQSFKQLGIDVHNNQLSLSSDLTKQTLRHAITKKMPN